MKKSTIILILVLIIISGFIGVLTKVSYSFIKNYLIHKEEVIVPIEEKIENNIDEIEDLIYIPKRKNFKDIFLQKINKNQLIVIRIPESILYYYKYNPITKKKKLIKKYPVAIGRKTRQTPVGQGIVYTKGHIVFRKRYGTNAGQIVEKGHTRDGKEFDMPYDKMFGLYMIVNQTDTYVIHSTTEYWKIGWPVSGGCVRMLIPDMLELYPYIKPPIQVVIEYKLFKMEKNMLTIYPDIYKKYYSLHPALMTFFRENNINPVIFNQEKIKKVLFNSLPRTIEINHILDDYFIKRKLSFNEIKIKYKDLLKNNRIKQLNEFFVQHN